MDSIYFKSPWFFLEKKKWGKITPYCQFQDCGKSRLCDKEYRCLSCGITLCYNCHRKVTFRSPMLKEECEVFCSRCAKYVKEVSKRELEKFPPLGPQPGVRAEVNANALHSNPHTKVNDSQNLLHKLFFGSIKKLCSEPYVLSSKKKSDFSAPDPLPVPCSSMIATRETMEPYIAPMENPPPNSVTKTWKHRFSSTTQNSSISNNKKKPEGSCIEDRNAETPSAEHHTRDKQLKERRRICESDSESMFPLSDGYVPSSSLSTSTPSSGLPNIPRLPLSPPPPAVSIVKTNISCASTAPPLSHGGDVALQKGGKIDSISTPPKEIGGQKRALNQKPILSSESKYARNHGNTAPFLSSSSHHQLSLNAESQQSGGFDLTNHTVSDSNKAATTSTSTYDCRTAKANAPALPFNSSSIPYPLSTPIPVRSTTTLKGEVETKPEHHFTDEDESFVGEKEDLLRWSDQLAQKERSISEFLADLLEKAQQRENYIQYLEGKLSEVMELHLSYVNGHLAMIEREEEEQREMLLEEEDQ